MAIQIEIDPRSGFCFGVVRAIELAEAQLQNGKGLLCLGDIVHNEEEVARLERLGLETIYQDRLSGYTNRSILFRAHGEPPATYAQARRQGLEVIDATCPVVLALQRRMAQRGEELQAIGGQILIYGKPDHAEVNGLLGQTQCHCVVVQSMEDLEQVDFTRATDCFSQTTMSPHGYAQVVNAVRARMSQALDTSSPPLRVHQTTCNQVATRKEHIAAFAAAHDAILFVSGLKSSNGRMLFAESKRVNPRTYFITSHHEVECSWLQGVQSVGICGATSTPRWLMEAVVEHVRTHCMEEHVELND